MSLDLGALIDDGLLAENIDFLDHVLSYDALNPISREQCLATMDYYCNSIFPILTPSQNQSIIGFGTGAGPGLDGIALSCQAIFCHLQKNSDEFSFSCDGVEEEKRVNSKELFSTAPTLADASAVILQALIKKLSKTLFKMRIEQTIEMNKPLTAYGVDSLLAIKLRNWIAKEFLADMAVFEISSGSTFSSVGLFVAARSKTKHVSWSLS